MFSSTKGHHGNKEIYKYTIKDFEKKYGLDFFDKKIFHIKNTSLCYYKHE